MADFENNTPIIVGIGERHAKKRFFRMFFPDKNIEFKQIILSKNKPELYRASINLNGKKTTILLSKFLDHQNIGYEGLKILTEMIKEEIKSRGLI